MTSGMSLIVRTVTRLAVTFIILFGIYVALYGHLSPGGGFAGGAIAAAGFILLLLAFGHQHTKNILAHDDAIAWDCAGALAFLLVAVLGYVAGTFFINFLSSGEPYQLASAGTIPIVNMAIGAKVGAGLFGVFLALAAFRSIKQRENKS